MPDPERRLNLTRQPSMPISTAAYWQVTDTSPPQDSQFWTERFFHLMEAQPLIESLVLGLVPAEDGTLSENYASSLNQMVMLGNLEEAPDLQLRQSQLMMCLYQDVGLVARAFMVEIGMKALLRMCGQPIKRWHKLAQLYDLLHPIARQQLDVAYRKVEDVPPLPNEVVRIGSLKAILSTYDNLYTEIRYRPTLIGEGPILSAWFHLKIAANTILFTILTHRSNLAMRHSYLAAVEAADGQA